MTLGVHFALTQEDVDALRAIKNNRKRFMYVQSELETEFFSNRRAWLAENDKAWDAMHRSLTNGQLNPTGGECPFFLVVLGGELICGPDTALKSPEEVKEVSTAIETISESDFRIRYFNINPKIYGMPLSEEDFRYTWSYFEDVRDLFRRAAETGRYILFTASD